MKIRISDIMDQIECTPVELSEQNGFSSRRVREKTLQKIHNASTKYNLKEKFSRMRRIPKAVKIPKVGITIAVLVLCISTTATAGVIMKWNGFVYTGGLNRQEKEALMEEAGTAYAGAIVNEIDGSVHYLDENGNEIMVLSAAEAAEYEAARRNAKEQAVVESTSLIDAGALPLIPSGITEVETAENGEFADFMLGNGHMILLHPVGGDSYRLSQGDTVTIMLEADGECRLEFRVYQDGDSIGEEISLTQQHCYQFTAVEDGLYNFSAMYYSAGANMFTNGSIIFN